MLRGWRGTGLRVALLAAVFGAGYVCGSFGAPGAEAQVSDAMRKPEQKKGADPQNGGGGSGLVGQLGSTINDMQQRVDGIQKDLETLRTVKGALGG